MKNSKEQQISNCFFDGINELVFCSFRYYLGRMTIANVQFAESLAQCYPLLNDNIKALIKRELTEEFRRDDLARSNGEKYLPLGDESDRNAWQKVLDIIEENCSDCGMIYYNCLCSHEDSFEEPC